MLLQMSIDHAVHVVECITCIKSTQLCWRDRETVCVGAAEGHPS